MCECFSWFFVVCNLSYAAALVKEITDLTGPYLVKDGLNKIIKIYALAI